MWITQDSKPNHGRGSLLASFEITEVHVAISASESGAYHDHIGAVRCKHGLELDRQTVVNDIRYGSDSYYTYGASEYADVIVRDCPDCDFGDYITTTPDSTMKNNLLDLPRY
jgi:Protein of unknown function (DUF3892)